MADASTDVANSGHGWLVRRVRQLSWLTLVWLTIDGAIGMTAGIAADSVALVGWGLDCGIQAAACAVILWRFTGSRVHSPSAELLAQKVVAASFLLLAPYIVVVALDHLVTGGAAGSSWLGIGLAAVDVALMPLIGRAKERVGRGLGSTATTSGGRQNILCAYLSLAVLVGLGANALLGWWWADPVVALAVAIVAVQTGIRTWRRGVENC